MSDLRKKIKKKEAKHLSVGKIGEQIAVYFLVQKGFKIVEKNVNRKWGELDIVVKKKMRGEWRFHIIEVKTVSKSVAFARMHPAENLTQSKLKKLERTSILYCQENNIENWQLDAVLVWFDKVNNKSEIQYIQNIL